jgi:CheY-like chemotaxis protein
MLMANRHVLVVDDNPDDATVLTHIIAFLMKHQVATASSGTQALTMAQEEQFDVIITDLNMPLMDGISLTEALRKLESYKRVPIIAVTAYDTATDHLRTMLAGCNLYLTKPISVDRLMAALGKFLS